MSRIRGISDIVAVLGLVAIAAILVVIGYYILSNYLTQAFSPSYDLTVTYAKLVFITDNEYVAGTTYTSFKAEVGIANPGRPQQIRVCIVSAVPTATGYAATTFTGAYECPTVIAEPGYNVYGFIIRVSNNALASIGCTNYANCPIIRNWYIAVFDAQGNPVSIVKPVYIIP